MLYIFEDYALDTDRRELRRGDAVVPVQPQVFDLLAYLIYNRERVVTKDDMVDAIWGGRIVSESTLTSRINAARTAVDDSGEDQRLIRTLPRKGIRFVGTVQEMRNYVDGSLSAETPQSLADQLAARARSAMGFKMRDPARIRRIMQLFEEVWALCSEFRMGQLMMYLLPNSIYPDAFHLEDDRLEEILRATLAEMKAETALSPTPCDQAGLFLRLRR
jgi:DNA-binding winged helix-turn-helix (wHTH) protein